MKLRKLKTVMLADSLITHNRNAMFATLELYIPGEKIWI